VITFGHAGLINTDCIDPEGFAFAEKVPKVFPTCKSFASNAKELLVDFCTPYVRQAGVCRVGGDVPDLALDKTRGRKIWQYSQPTDGIRRHTQRRVLEAVVDNSLLASMRMQM
jgi:hypothetical protein